MNNRNHSKYYTDENVVRIIASQVIAISMVSLFTQRVWPLSLLLVDFALRAFTLGPSPLAAIAKMIVRVLKLKPKPIFAAPKKFAALTGFIFLMMILLLFLLNLYPAAYLVTGILMVCAVLESVFKICLGCYVYNWFVAPVVHRKNIKNEETKTQL